MPKPKGPTPQELYWAKKEAQEAYLPPGLINHGNTCFMNSVLQGLMATRLLSDLVQFNEIPESSQALSTTRLSSKRSPQLTNGHGRGGEYEKERIDMPIGDKFIDIMYRAWGIQSSRRRENISPKDLLAAVGRKYDQFLDFAQQDAHEFLRILLDAMRMEEQDVIKLRQPQALKPKKRRTLPPAIPISPGTTISPASLPQDEDTLMSFSDMVFGGKLTSILICQKCKHISRTYEDFNDISLSLKPEDYQTGKKKDRFKKFAKKLAAFPISSHSNSATSENVKEKGKEREKEKEKKGDPNLKPKEAESGSGFLVAGLTPGGVGMQIQRSSSVPPSPRERQDPQFAETPVHVVVKRRSMENLQSSGSIAHRATTTVTTESEQEDEDAVVVNVSEVLPTPSEEKHVDFEERIDERKEKKKKDSEDSWAKFGRRISMSVGFGKKDKDKEKKRKGYGSVEPIPETRKATEIEREIPPTPPSSLLSPPSNSRPPSRPSTPDQNQEPILVQSPIPMGLNSLTSNEGNSQSHPFSPPTTLPLSTPAPITSPPSLPTPPNPQVYRSKSPIPPKQTPEEEAYLRRILADVRVVSSTFPFTSSSATAGTSSAGGIGDNSASAHTSVFGGMLKHLPHHNNDHTNSNSNSNPNTTTSNPTSHSNSNSNANSNSHSNSHSKSGFTSILDSPLHTFGSGKGGGGGGGGGGLWLPLGVSQFSGLEECLRMFTAVEVLDGENMVGCRRCWKIANGIIDEDEDEDEEDNEDEDEEGEDGDEDEDEEVESEEEEEEEEEDVVEVEVDTNEQSQTQTQSQNQPIIQVTQSTPGAFDTGSTSSSMNSRTNLVNVDNNKDEDGVDVDVVDPTSSGLNDPEPGPNLYTLPTSISTPTISLSMVTDTNSISTNTTTRSVASTEGTTVTSIVDDVGKGNEIGIGTETGTVTGSATITGSGITTGTGTGTLTPGGLPIPRISTIAPPDEIHTNSNTDTDIDRDKDKDNNADWGSLVIPETRKSRNRNRNRGRGRGSNSSYSSRSGSGSEVEYQSISGGTDIESDTETEEEEEEEESEDESESGSGSETRSETRNGSGSGSGYSSLSVSQVSGSGLGLGLGLGMECEESEGPQVPPGLEPESESQTPGMGMGQLNSGDTVMPLDSGMTKTKSKSKSKSKSEKRKVKDSEETKEKEDRKREERERRKKEMILRPAYKRYLVEIPPPVLVIHLKRFQQLGNSSCSPCLSTATATATGVGVGVGVGGSDSHEMNSNINVNGNSNVNVDSSSGSGSTLKSSAKDKEKEKKKKKIKNNDTLGRKVSLKSKGIGLVGVGKGKGKDKSGDENLNPSAKDVALKWGSLTLSGAPLPPSSSAQSHNYNHRHGNNHASGSGSGGNKFKNSTGGFGLGLGLGGLSVGHGHSHGVGVGTSGFGGMGMGMGMGGLGGGFKKLEEYVSFPEFLDLGPFLAPRKEEFGVGRKRKGKGKGKDKDKEMEVDVDVDVEKRCVYRLYAVVVHIGNMLGGHYVAYTALPSEPPLHQVAKERKGKRQWAYISDTTVRLASLEEVLNARAYICMYERVWL